jgi:uncharacterized protein YyaL (SSP411 family)
MQALREQLAQAHQALLHARSRRIRPATDDKVLVSWNALTLITLAEAARYLRRPDYLAAARANADFILRVLHPHERLLRSWRAGIARHDAYLEDYAGLILGLIALYQSDPDPRWFTSALALLEEVFAQYADPAGGFFDTRGDAAALISRPKDYQDNATPSGNALLTTALLQLAEYSGQSEWKSRAEASLAALQDAFVRHPTAFGCWLSAAQWALEPVQQVALVGRSGESDYTKMIEVLWSAYRPNLVAAFAGDSPAPGSPELCANRPMRDGRATAYVCRGFVCLEPALSAEKLAEQL